MDPLFFYSLIVRAVLLVPLAGLIPAFIGVIACKGGTVMDVFVYRRKLTIFVLIFAASAVAGYAVTIASVPELTPGQVARLAPGPYLLVGIFTTIIPGIAYGYLANASAKRFIDMSKSKFLALALVIPLVNFGVMAYLALTFASKQSET